MILLLGKNDLVENYAKSVLKVNINENFIYCPNFKEHYTQFSKYIDIIRYRKPFVITTQDIEMIKLLLTSDLCFEVYTVFENGLIRKLSKEQAINAYDCLGIDLRY